jgi:hypothetical protein
MPLTEKGEKIKSAMEQQYGPEKGERVFYASKNAGTISGVDARRADQAAQQPMALPAQTPAEQLHDAETALDWLQREHQQLQDDRYWKNAIGDQQAIVQRLRGSIKRETDEALGRKRFGVGDGYEAMAPDDGQEPLRQQEGLQQVEAACDQLAQRLDACASRLDGDAAIRGGGGPGANVMTR